MDKPAGLGSLPAPIGREGRNWAHSLPGIRTGWTKSAAVFNAEAESLDLIIYHEQIPMLSAPAWSNVNSLIAKRNLLLLY